MFPEHAWEMMMHFWQNITSCVMPYCEKAEHVVKDPVQKSYNTLMTYAQSTHLFDVLLLLNEKTSQKIHFVRDLIVNSQQRQQAFQKCSQDFCNLLTFIREIIVSIIVLPFTLFWIVYSFVLAQLTWFYVVVPQIIKDTIVVIKYIAKHSYERGVAAREDYSQGRFDYKELLYNTLHGVRSLIIRFNKYFGRQNFVVRYIIKFDILQTIQKYKEKVKPTKKSE